MKAWHFSENAYPYLPPADEYESIRVSLPNRFYDPKKGATLYDRYSRLVYSVALRVLREPAAAESIPVVADEAEPMIVKTKQFVINPMIPEDAVFHLELIGHDFFVFRSADTGEVNVVYGRRDRKSVV